MPTCELVPIDKEHPDEITLQRAASLLRKGGVVVYPADTVYSLAVNAFDDEAVQKIYEIKGREAGKPIHVLAKDLSMIHDLVKVDETADRFLTRFFPGFLNLVLKDKGKVSRSLVSASGTLGVRIPDFAVTRLLSSLSDLPYTGTSANPSGGKSPYSVDTLFSQFSPEKVSLIDLVLDAGTLPKILPSTILDLTKRPPHLVREGPISRQELENFLGDQII